MLPRFRLFMRAPCWCMAMSDNSAQQLLWCSATMLPTFHHVEYSSPTGCMLRCSNPPADNSTVLECRQCRLFDTSPDAANDSHCRLLGAPQQSAARRHAPADSRTWGGKKKSRARAQMHLLKNVVESYRGHRYGRITRAPPSHLPPATFVQSA